MFCLPQLPYFHLANLQYKGRSNVTSLFIGHQYDLTVRIKIPYLKGPVMFDRPNAYDDGEKAKRKQRDANHCPQVTIPNSQLMYQ